MFTSEFNQDCFIRATDVRQRYSISNVTLHRWIKSGKIPEPQYLNSQRVWRLSVLKDAEQEMLASAKRTQDHFVMGGAS